MYKYIANLNEDEKKSLMEDGVLYRMASVKAREKILEDFDLRYGDKKEATKPKIIVSVENMFEKLIKKRGNKK